MAGTHVHPEHEDHPWTIQIPDHAKRTESRGYVASRATMNRLAKGAENLAYGRAPFQDHHGGGLWLKDDDGWFLVRNLVGIEWSAQFCADPAKVDLLRQNARRLYAAFPDAVEELGIRELLDTPITDAAGISRWTDSICNASLPLPAAFHTGVLPKASTPLNLDVEAATPWDMDAKRTNCHMLAGSVNSDSPNTVRRAAHVDRFVANFTCFQPGRWDCLFDARKLANATYASL